MRCENTTLMRTNTIVVSSEEKRMLDEAAVELTGTKDLPYGAVLTMLIREATGLEVER